MNFYRKREKRKCKVRFAKKCKVGFTQDIKQQNLVWGSDLEQGFLFIKRMSSNIKFQDIKF